MVFLLVTARPWGERSLIRSFGFRHGRTAAFEECGRGPSTGLCRPSVFLISGVTPGYGVGGLLICRLLLTPFTPLTLRTAASASAFTWALGTSPARVTIPLVTLVSTFRMLEKRASVSFALTAVEMAASSICAPGDCVVVQPATKASSTTAAATPRIPGIRFLMMCPPPDLLGPGH